MRGLLSSVQLRDLLWHQTFILVRISPGAICETSANATDVQGQMCTLVLCHKESRDSFC